MKDLKNSLNLFEKNTIKMLKTNSVMRGYRHRIFNLLRAIRKLENNNERNSTGN